MKRIVYSLVIVLFVVSCTPSIRVPPTTMFTDTSQLNSTPTGVPTSTDFPTFTPVTTTATISVSPTPSYTPTVSPTISSSFLTAQVSWDICDGAEEPHYQTALSPDNNWLAVACDPNDPSKFNGAKIIKLSGNAIWDVSFYETYGIFQQNELPPDGIRVGQIGVAHWTNDGNYVYLYPHFCCADSPQNIFFNYFRNAPALYRLDLITGKLAVILQPFKDDVFSGYYASFSPTDKNLVYVISNSPRDINFYNLHTGDSFTITVDEQYIASGNFSWSKDGNKAIFMAAKSGWDMYQNPIEAGISYFLMDLKERKSIRLFDKEDLYRITWTQDDNIILHNVSGTDGLLYDFQNNDFTVITPTPQP